MPDEALDEGVTCYRGRTAYGVLRGLGQAPELAERWLAFYVPLTKEDGRLPIELKELVRLQIAGLYGCDYCSGFITPLAQARGLTTDKTCWVMEPDHPDAPFLPAERVMPRYTLTMATGAGALTDADMLAARLLPRRPACRTLDAGRRADRLRRGQPHRPATGGVVPLPGATPVPVSGSNSGGAWRMYSV